MDTQVLVIDKPNQMLDAFEIRRKVFVIEQNVKADEEYDEHEETCTHLLAKQGSRAVGTARIRKTDKGTKLERFAVLKDCRQFGIGSQLLLQALDICKSEKYIYLHAQEQVLHFYAKHGFKPVGERFFECNIPHFKMELEPTENS